MKEIRFLVVGLSVLSGVFSGGAADVQWTEVRPADVEGRLWDDVERPFDRIPLRAKKALPAVWGNGKTPTGQLVDFEKFFDILCSKRPTTPVILLGAPHCCNLWVWPEKLAAEEEKTRLFGELAPKVAARHKNFRYVPGQGLYGDGEWSMDGVHPNDEAFANMAKKLAPILREVLSSRVAGGAN